MRRVMTVLRVTCGVLAVVLAVAYAVGRIATDRMHVTQYLFWAPSFVFLVPLLGLTATAWVLGRRGLGWGRRGRGGRSRERKRVFPMWRVAGVLFLLVLAHALVFEWRVWRYVLPARAAAPGQSVRIMHWNVTHAPSSRWDRYIAALYRAPHPDVLIVSNPVGGKLLGAMGAELGPEYKTVRAGNFAIFTNLPVLEQRGVALDIPEDYTGRARHRGSPESDGTVEPKTDYLPRWSPIPRMGSNMFDPGHAVCVRIDATAQLGREIVIWGIDLPSQPRAWRKQVADAAAARLYTLTTASSIASERFSAPDIILGDFNTPRGSASLGLISLGFPHAFDQAGRGYVATWPRHRPMFHIDHMFIGPGLRAASYRVIDMGISEHRAQTAEITSVSRP